MKRKAVFSAYTHPAGGWGSVHSLTRSLTRERVPLSGTQILMHQNKPQGFACVSCSWAKPAKPRPFEFCEEGAKATTWEITNRRCTPEFFAKYTVSELEAWTDHDLEEQGRLTQPLRWDASSDKYVPVEWEQAIREIGGELRSCSIRTVSSSTVRAEPPSKRRICMRCSRAYTALTTFPIAPIFATRAHRLGCHSVSACRSAP